MRLPSLELHHIFGQLHRLRFSWRMKMREKNIGHPWFLMGNWREIILEWDGIFVHRMVEMLSKSEEPSETICSWLVAAILNPLLEIPTYLGNRTLKWSKSFIFIDLFPPKKKSRDVSERRSSMVIAVFSRIFSPILWISVRSVKPWWSNRDGQTAGLNHLE